MLSTAALGGCAGGVFDPKGPIAAAERLIRIKTNTQVRVAAEDDSDDFSSEPPATFEQLPPKLRFNQEEWTDRIRKLSARF